MQLSVIHRITGGYFLLIVGLITIAIAGISSLTRINSGIHKITEKATPITRVVTQISNELAFANLTMYRHYNSKSAQEIVQYESEFNQSLERFFRLSKELRQQLVDVSDNSEIIKDIDKLDQQSPEVFDAIVTLMGTYKGTFFQFQELVSFRAEILSIVEKINGYQLAIQNYPVGSIHYNLIGQYQNLVSEGITIVKLLIYSSDIDTLDKQYLAWINRFVELGYQLDNLKYSGNKLGQFIVENDSLITAMSWRLIEIGGLIEVSKTYRGTQKLMTNNLGKNEKDLAAITRGFNTISEYSRDLSNAISDEANNAVINGKKIIIGITLLTVLACFIIAIIVVRSINSPLKQVTKIIKDLALGNLSTEIFSARKDEFGSLLRSANTLQGNLRDMIMGIKNQSNLIVKSVRVTESVSQKTQTTIDEQKKKTLSIASAMQAVSSTSNHIAQSAEDTLLKMVDAHDQAKSGQVEVDNNKTQADQLNFNMGAAVTVITQLDDDIRAIETVIDVIESIAEQTNLLALNAAIEAARAGEQGRGFAVVADEVRALAGKTRASTEEIKSTISTLLNASSDAVKTIDTAKETTEEASKSAIILHTKIGDIVENITTIKGLNVAIASAAEEQKSTSLAMEKNISYVSELSESTSVLAKKNSQQVEDLHRSSNDLENMVSKFRL